MKADEQGKVIRDFLNEHCKKHSLSEQLNWLKTYNFAKLGVQEGVHEDSTSLVKAIYFKIWHTSVENDYSLPMLGSFDDMKKHYGGETINTFNSLFQESLEGAKMYVSEEDTEFYEKVKNFRKLYLTIGNFMLLPLGKLKGTNITLNTKKGSYNFRYKDYSDLFFYDLWETSELDDLKDANQLYFNNLTKEEFFKINLLDDYYENEHAKIIFPHDYYCDRYYPLYWWKYKNPNEHSKEYRDFAVDYIEEATKIINSRADKICDILKEML